MNALTDFILARVVEDEAEVDALLGEWGRLADGRRLERQCEAYRRIVASESAPYVDGHAPNTTTLRLLASVYSDHPDYNPAWA